MSVEIQDQFTNLGISHQLKWRLRNMDKWRLYSKKRYLEIKNDPVRYQHLREIQRLSRRGKTRIARIEVIKAMGGKCVRCAFSDWRALQIDHVNGDGSKERISKSGKRRSFDCNASKKMVLEGYRLGRYQILCSNCNWIKRHENHEHGREPICQQ